ncbi:MAG: hypothetical protein CTY27_05835 [Methylotenera sp.]|nr:MAG: hypothetical protein CTY27_05835 [Methylotenera sp.]
MDIIFIVLVLLGALLLKVFCYRVGRKILDKFGLENKFNGRFSFGQISDFVGVFLIVLIIVIISVVKNA